MKKLIAILVTITLYSSCTFTTGHVKNNPGANGSGSTTPAISLEDKTIPAKQLPSGGGIALPMPKPSSQAYRVSTAVRPQMLQVHVHDTSIRK